MEPTNYELIYHHGIKGMKWGIRRFQNKDGTRTEAGKRRARQGYSETIHDDYKRAHERKSVKSMSDDELNKRINRLKKERSYNVMTKTPGKLERSKKVIDASSNLVRTAKQMNDESMKPVKKKLDLSKMSDQELRDKINRANLERQYNDLFAEYDTPTISKGRENVTKIIEGVGTALTITSSAVGLALAIKELRGG